MWGGRISYVLEAWISLVLAGPEMFILITLWSSKPSTPAATHIEYDKEIRLLKQKNEAPRGQYIEFYFNFHLKLCLTVSPRQDGDIS